MPDLEPVSGDPFASQLIPVAGNPFDPAQKLGPGWGPFSDPIEESGPPAPLTFSDRWNPVANLPGQSFSERLEKVGAEPGLVEDRRSENDAYAHMLATNQMLRKILGNWTLSFDKPRPPRQSGHLQEEAGRYDIGRPYLEPVSHDPFAEQ